MVSIFIYCIRIYTSNLGDEILARSRVNAVIRLLITYPQLLIRDSTHPQNTLDITVAPMLNKYSRSINLVDFSNRRKDIKVSVNEGKKYPLLLFLPQQFTNSHTMRVCEFFSNRYKSER